MSGKARSALGQGKPVWGGARTPKFSSFGFMHDLSQVTAFGLCSWLSLFDYMYLKAYLRT